MSHESHSACRASFRTWWKIAIHVPACNSTRARRARDADRESCVRRNAQSHTRVHFSRGESPRAGSGVAGCSRVTLYITSCPFVPHDEREATRRMVFAVQRSGNELSSAVEVISRKYWKVRPAPSSGSHSFPARRFERRFLANVAHKWNPTRACDKEEIESVRMEQLDRSRKGGTVLSRSMNDRQWQDYTRRTEHERSLFF